MTFKYRWLLNRGDNMGRFDCIWILQYKASVSLILFVWFYFFSSLASRQEFAEREMYVTLTGKNFNCKWGRKYILCKKSLYCQIVYVRSGRNCSDKMVHIPLHPKNWQLLGLENFKLIKLIYKYCLKDFLLVLNINKNIL